jgi:DnaJ domain
MTYYDVLGLSPDASTYEVERAFRALALRIHPDRNQGATGAADRMKELNRIRMILTDPDLRASYDVGLEASKISSPVSLSSAPASRGAGAYAVMRRLGLGFLFGGGLALLWGPMLRSDERRDGSVSSALTGFLVGVLCASIRLPGAPTLGGAVLGLVVSLPYGLANHAHSSIWGGAAFGGVIAWVVSWRVAD